MTKDEFIDGYLKRSGIEKYRTPDGYMIQNCSEKVALPCTCGEAECEGWAMVTNDPSYIAEHKRLYG